MADIIFSFYIIFMVIVFVVCVTPQGKSLQQEYMAFRTTQKYMHSKGLKWPPNERWS